MAETRSKSKKTLQGVDFIENPELPPGQLPTKRNVIEVLLYTLRPKRAGQSQLKKQDAAAIVSSLVHEHWIFCNVYTVTTHTISNRIIKLYEQFMSLVQTRISRQNDSFKAKASDFLDNVDTVFDVFCENERQRKGYENDNNVKMTETEWKFLQDQRTDRKMVCDGYVDRKWLKSMQRRSKDTEAWEKRRTVKEELHSNAVGDLDSSATEEHVSETSQWSSDDTNPPSRKRRRTDIEENPNDDIPERYRHVRLGPRKIRPELYETLDKLKSSYHMSQMQAEAAVIEVGNKMFGRKWKSHSDSAVIDLDTLPHKHNILKAGKSIEVMALDEIAKEVMNSDSKATITYCDDGSKKQGVGSFTVQGIIINDTYRALPTLPIASESRTNLADLKLVTLDILATASAVDKKDLFERIDFVITDQTTHNVNVEAIVADKLESESVPGHLFCNVHPSLMFNRVITKQWSEVEELIGRDKIYANFLVNATTKAESVTQQALDCMTRLINHDFDSKPWNKANEFDAHISPKKNRSVSLKDERFNRLTLTCAIALYHYDDLATFLDKYQHVTNQLACIVRCFMDLETLKVMFCVDALLGLHLVEPFLSLTTSSETTYSKLIPAFKQLYDDLINTNPERLLSTQEAAFTFVSKERFEHVKYHDDVCAAVESVTQQYRSQV